VDVMKKRILILAVMIFWAGCAGMPEKAVVPDRFVFYPPLPEEPRIQFLCSISGAQDLGKEQGALWRFLVGDVQYKSLGRPYDIAASEGKIYLLDRGYRKLVILDLEKGSLSFLNDMGSGRLVNPSGIWVTGDGVKYVTDMGRRQVVVFDENNRFVRAYGGDEMMEKPVDVAVSGDRVYVVDMKKNVLLILDRATGDLVATVGEEGDFFKPSHVTVGPAGNLFVTDAFNFRIRKLAPDGTFIADIGFHGDQIGGFARPKGLALDREGRLYAVDAAFENVQIFNVQGKVLLFFGGAGSGPGDLYLPAGIAVDYRNVAFFSKFADPNFRVDYLVYVVSTYGDRKLNVYGFGHWVGGAVPEEGGATKSTKGIRN